MSTLKVNTIRHTGASSDAVTLATDGTCTVKATNNLSNRNLTINGAMQVAQRGTSSTDHGMHTIDRWSHFRSGVNEAPTFSQADIASGTTPYELGFRKSLKTVNGNQTGGAGASDYISYDYKWESQDIANSGWNYTSTSSYVTLSFWVKSSVAQNFYFHLTTKDGTTQNYPMETGSLSANTWTKITKKIPGNSNLQFDNNNDAGLQIRVLLFRGTNTTGTSIALNTWAAYNTSVRTPDNTSTWYTTNDATFELTGAQLEVGDVATDFEHRSYGDELARCQRYYYDHLGGFPENDTAYGVGSVYNSGYVFSYIPFRVQMRAKPTLESNDNASSHNVLIGATSHPSSKNVLSSAGTSSAFIYPWVGTISVTVGDCGILRTFSTTNCKLRFNAEL
tara:strand:+ start:874 stop:2049 length:1176 start_codon:yes stop_codon:yes gene_type:complete